ncbi:hypothetical protein ABT282_06980 [Streptomyces sp. NPDC000927]|uniref:hypothetical protein n=1 Tax=Streptomyces sp. NPDC000927 TaxID=3154371 RepID=UPI00332BECB4
MDDTWIEQGQQISNTNELREYIADIRASAHHMQTGLARAAWGALNGYSWDNTPYSERVKHEEFVRQDLDMTVPPSGMTARDALYRQSITALLAALDTVDRATLAAWLADVNAQDPDRPA